MGDGTKLADHYRAVAAMGVAVPELEPPPVPAACQALLAAFWQLRQAAGSNGVGPASITHQSVAAWAGLYGVTFTPWEVETLFVMDAAALEAHRGGAKSGNNSR